MTNKNLQMSKTSSKELELPKGQVSNSHFQIKQLTSGMCLLTTKTYQLTNELLLNCPFGNVSSLLILLKI